MIIGMNGNGKKYSSPAKQDDYLIRTQGKLLDYIAVVDLCRFIYLLVYLNTFMSLPV